MAEGRGAPERAAGTLSEAPDTPAPGPAPAPDLASDRAPDPHTFGAILAGGRSRRFGSPKAGAPFLGEPMVLRPLRALARVAARVAVVGRPAELTDLVGRGALAAAASEGAPDLVPRPAPHIVPDIVPDAGPLGGLHAALLAARDAGAEAVLLVGCDMPLVSPGLLAAVARQGRAGDRPAAVPRGDHPLCGWYRVDCLRLVQERLHGPDRSLHGLLDAVGAWRIPLSRLGADAAVRVRSANTPDDLAALEVQAVEAGETGLVPVVCVVGWKDAGKTGTAVGLVAELRRRGYRVAAVKHGHGFRLDTPGTDSWRLRHEGGADPVLLAGPEGFGLMGSWPDGEEPGLAGLLRRFPGLAEVDVVVAEGFKWAPFARVEVYRQGGRGEEPIFRSGGPPTGRLLALVTDGPEEPEVAPRIDLDDPGRSRRLADLVEARVMGRPAPKARDENPDEDPT